MGMKGCVACNETINPKLLELILQILTHLYSI